MTTMNFSTASDGPSERNLFRLVLWVWFILAIAMAVRTSLRPESHTVFPVLVAGVDHWWQDKSLYANYKPLDYFRYPPVFAVVLTPLAWLGVILGGILWGWLNLTIYAWGLIRFIRDVVPVRWSPFHQTTFLLLATFGGLRGLWNGQSNALVIGLILLGMADLVRQRFWLGGGWLGCAVLIKLTPIILVLLILAIRPGRLIRPIIVVLSMGLLIPFLTRQAGEVILQYQNWWVHLTGMAGERWPGFRDAWTVTLIAQNALGWIPGPLSLEEPLRSPLYRLVQIVTGLLTLLWCWSLNKRCNDYKKWILGTLALGITWLMIFGPAIEHATYVFLAPPLTWGLIESWRTNQGRGLMVSASIMILVFGWGAIAMPLRVLGEWPLAALPIGTGIFAIWVLTYQGFRGYSDHGEVTRNLEQTRKLLIPA